MALCVRHPTAHKRDSIPIVIAKLSYQPLIARRPDQKSYSIASQAPKRTPMKSSEVSNR